MGRLSRFGLLGAAAVVAAALAFGAATGAQTSTALLPAVHPAAFDASTLDKVVTRISADRIGTQGSRRALFAFPQLQHAGTQIRSVLGREHFSVNADSWVLFLDEKPGANWEHPAHYLVVNRANGAVTDIPARLPPETIGQLQASSPAAVADANLRMVGRNALLSGINPGILQLIPSAHMAILISGGINENMNYGRYWNDLGFAYKTLKQRYGFSDSDIIVLFANGTHSPDKDLDGDGKPDIDFAATKANLTAAFSQVAAKLQAGGTFLFLSTNHGGTTDAAGAKSVLYLWGDSISDDELGQLGAKIKAGQAYYAMEQCFSGGMLGELMGPRNCTNPTVCAMAAASPQEVSWGGADYDDYILQWVSAIAGHDPNGNAANADTNGDGQISMAEAHAYATAHDYFATSSPPDQREHPTFAQCNPVACLGSLSPPSRFRLPVRAMTPGLRPVIPPVESVPPVTPGSEMQPRPPHE